MMHLTLMAMAFMMMMMMMMTAVSSFSVTTSSRRTSLVTTQRSFPLHLALEEVDANDPFENYEISGSTTDIATKDIVIGTGDLVEGEGQLLTVKYTGKFLADGKQFDKSDDFLARIGRNKVLPGFEKGLMVR